MNLFHANRQWSTRPDDERFTSIQDLFNATVSYAKTAVEKEAVRVDTLRVEAVNDQVQVVGRGNIPAQLTHWSFGQLAYRVGAPAAYLRKLPATLAAQNINHGLAKWAGSEEEKVANMLFHSNGTLLLRAITSDRYSRVWNFEVAERLLDMEQRGWAVARPDFNQQDGKLPLYASDHDMFAFVVHSDRVIKEGSNNPLGLKRGLIVSNSEVGAGALRMVRFLYREMCGNHIIWGAEDVSELSAIHVGDVHAKFAKWQLELKKYIDGSAAGDEARIQHLMTKRIAGTKEELLDALFGKRLGLTRKALEGGYACVSEGDGDPLTPWGIAQGLTRYSQTVPYADERTGIDRAAGRLLDAF